MGSIATVSKQTPRTEAEPLGNDSPPEIEAIANAHLIAAAPCLFDALCDIMNEPRGSGIDPAHRRKAYMAILKARGVQNKETLRSALGIPIEQPKPNSAA